MNNYNLSQIKTLVKNTTKRIAAVSAAKKERIKAVLGEHGEKFGGYKPVKTFDINAIPFGDLVENCAGTYGSTCTGSLLILRGGKLLSLFFKNREYTEYKTSGEFAGSNTSRIEEVLKDGDAILAFAYCYEVKFSTSSEWEVEEEKEGLLLKPFIVKSDLERLSSIEDNLKSWIKSIQL